MFLKIEVAFLCREHIGGPYFQFIQVTVLFTKKLSQLQGFRIFSENRLDVLVMYAIQLAVFKCLDIVKAFLLPEQAFKQYDRMIFFHKPGRYFMFIPFIITPYQSLLQIPGIAAYLSLKKQKFIFLLFDKTASLSQFRFQGGGDSMLLV